METKAVDPTSWWSWFHWFYFCFVTCRNSCQMQQEYWTSLDQKILKGCRPFDWLATLDEGAANQTRMWYRSLSDLVAGEKKSWAVSDVAWLVSKSFEFFCNEHVCFSLCRLLCNICSLHADGQRWPCAVVFFRCFCTNVYSVCAHSSFTLAWAPPAAFNQDRTYGGAGQMLHTRRKARAALQI